MSRFTPGQERDTPSLPGTPSSGRTGGHSRRPQPSNKETDYIQILDDDELDELATDSIPCSSPYFTQPTQLVNVNRVTQPTQLVNRGTQPTQIVKPRTTLRAPSSPLIPSSPRTEIEVPASSPFRPKSASKPTTSNTMHRRPGMAGTGRVGSLMAPAGTAFRPPVTHPSIKADRPAVKRQYLEISDDDLVDDYKKAQDSSDDESAVRGNIRPSSFLKRDQDKDRSIPAGVARAKPVVLPTKDITLNDIHDMRLRYLTRDVYRMVSKIKPGITIRACKEALLNGVNWQVSKAVEKLVGKTATANPTGTPRTSLSASQTLPAGTRNSTAEATTSFTRASDAEPTKATLSKLAQPYHPQTNQIKTSVNRASLDGSASTSNKSARVTDFERSSASLQVGNPNRSAGYSQLSDKPLPSKASFSDTISNKPPRRRLVQGRPRRSSPSPSPPPVFSLSSSGNTSISTPAQSGTASPSSSQAIAKMTRNYRGDISSDSDFTPVKKKPRRRRLQRGRRNPTPSPQSKGIVIDDSDTPESPQSSKISRAITSETLYKGKLNPGSDSRAETEPTDDILNSDPVESQDALQTDSPLTGEEAAAVLNYLHISTAEQIASMAKCPIDDAKLMVEARPFASVAEAEKVSRNDKDKSKSKRKRTEIGSLIVERLSVWFDAVHAVSRVIEECEDRGALLQKVMNRWCMDKNGEITNGVPLPIGQKPALMDPSVQLKSYQLFGLNWMSLMHDYGFSGILADDMGLGKTCQVIAMVAHLIDSYDEDRHSRPFTPVLIVVPSSTFENWFAEFQKFAPDISVMAYSGPKRSDIEHEVALEYNVILTTYSQVEKNKKDLDWMRALNPYAAIFDEGHKLKNKKTLIYQKMMRIPTEWRLILSGTPIQNNLKELLTMLHFIEPDLFQDDDFEQLDVMFEAKVPNKEVHNFAALAKERVAHARTIMVPFILQRRKGDVVDLPLKTERNVFVGMHPDQKAIYKEIKNLFLGPKEARRKSTIKDTNSWLQLRKAAIHHQLFRRHFTDKVVHKMADILWEHCSEHELCVQTKEDRHKQLFIDDIKQKSDFQLHLWCKEFRKYIGHLDVPHRSWEASPKVKKLLELLGEYKKNGDKVLVFSRFELVIDILRETLHHANIEYCELTGSTDTADRKPQVDRFTDNPDIPVFLLTTGAGGTGLNITAANKVILFDQSDNPQDDVQASNRAHRIGQARAVEVVRLLTKGSVEKLIYNSCVKKLVLAAYVEGQFEVVDDDGEKMSVEQQCRKMMLEDGEGDESDEGDEGGEDGAASSKAAV